MTWLWHVFESSLFYALFRTNFIRCDFFCNSSSTCVFFHKLILVFANFCLILTKRVSNSVEWTWFLVVYEHKKTCNCQSNRLKHRQRFCLRWNGAVRLSPFASKKHKRFSLYFAYPFSSFFSLLFFFFVLFIARACPDIPFFVRRWCCGPLSLSWSHPSSTNH